MVVINKAILVIQLQQKFWYVIYKYLHESLFRYNILIPLHTRLTYFENARAACSRLFAIIAAKKQWGQVGS